MSESSARRHDGEFGNGEERRAPNGVVKRNGSPLTAPRRMAKPPSSSTPNALIIFLRIWIYNQILFKLLNNLNSINIVICIC